MTGDPTTAPRELAQRWARNVAHDGGVVDGLDGRQRERLYAWALDFDQPDEDAAVREIISALDWEYHAGYGSPSYGDALALLRAARGAS